MIDADTVQAMNRAGPQLTLAEARLETLPIELNQLKRAIEEVSRPVTFASEPADFRIALLALAEETR